MRVDELKLVGALGYASLASLTLPERGVVLITGPNGAGKSAWVEAVAVGLWGETIRGTPPWHRDAAGEVVVRLSDPAVDVRRSREQGKTSLSVRGESAATASKTQEILDAIVGPLPLWAATHVVSAADAGRFTRATDGDRKRFLERLLALGAFDVALTSCRAELKTASSEKSDHERRAERQAAGREAEERRAADARAALACETDAKDQTERLDELDELTTQVEHVVSGARCDMDDASAALARMQTRVEIASKELARLAQGTCPTCGTELQDAAGQAARAAERLAELRTEADKLRAVAQAAGLRLRQALDEQADVHAELSKCQLDAQRWAANIETRRRAETTLYDSEARLRGYRDSEAASRAAADAAADRVNVLLCAERALGLQGIRAHILGEALAGIEQIANSWLARVAGPGLKLALSPSTEKASGGTRDAIGLDITGAGGGYGYKAASTGQQRRIDVALLFALAEVAGAAQARPPGTLWCDEVFAGLDSEGREALCGALVDLAADRCVVVISHEDDAVELLRPVRHVRVLDGAIVKEGA